MEIGAVTNNFFQALEKSVQEALKNDKVFQAIASCEEGLDVFSGSHIYMTKDKSGNQISLEFNDGKLVSHTVTYVDTVIEEEIAPGKNVYASYDAEGNLMEFRFSEKVPPGAEFLGIERSNHEFVDELYDKYKNRFKQNNSEVNSNVSSSNNAVQGNIFAQQNNETNINDIDNLPSEDTLNGNFRLRGTGKYGNTRKEAIENLVKELMQTSAGKIEIRGSKVFVDNKQEFLSCYEVNEDGEISAQGCMARFYYNDIYDINDPNKTPVENFLAKLPPEFSAENNAEVIDGNHLKFAKDDEYHILTINDEGKHIHTQVFSKDDGYRLSVGKYGDNKEEAMTNVIKMLQENADGNVIVEDNRIYFDNDKSYVRYYEIEHDGTIRKIGYEPRKVIEKEEQ